MLVLTRKAQESIMIGDQIEVTVTAVEGDQVRLGISAPPEVRIFRREIYDAIREENIRAAAAGVDDLETALEGEPRREE
jgi:carbon storage regulator